MLLTPYGLREWLTITVVAAAAAGLAVWFSLWWALAVVVVVWLALLSFFRDPPRRVPTDLPKRAMLSPADGVISKIERVETHEACAGPAVVIRIFLSVLNVHVNRAPFDCEVVSVTHRPGKYLDARSEESARVNESTMIVARIATGVTGGVTGGATGGEAGEKAGRKASGDARTETIGVKQISGAIARRIVCPLRPGEALRRGQRFGMIKFGSTTELILPRPEQVEVLVKVGQRVTGGRTLLAVLPPPQS